MSTRILRLLILALVAAVACGSVAPLAASGEGQSAVAAKKKQGSKCHKKGAKKGKKKAKRCKAGAPASQPGLPGKPLSPESPTAPAPPTVAGVSVTANPVLGGTGTSGQVTVGQPAPPGGRSVSLQSGDSARVSVPATVHVAAGQSAAGFAVTTTTGPTVLVQIEASIGSSSQQVHLNVVENPSVIGVALDYDCFPGPGLINFGANRVTLDVPAPDDTAVALQSGAPLSLSTPPSVTVAEGATSAIFGVNTLLLTATPVDVTATLGSSTATDSATVRNTLSPSAIEGLAINPSSVVAGAPSTGTVTLDCEALPGGAVVGLSSDNPGVVVPASVTVPNGHLSTTFPITTSGSATGQAVITATLGGTQQATLLLDQLGT